MAGEAGADGIKKEEIACLRAKVREMYTCVNVCKKAVQCRCKNRKCVLCYLEFFHKITKIKYFSLIFNEISKKH